MKKSYCSIRIISALLFFLFILSCSDKSSEFINVFDSGHLPFVKNGKLIQVSSYDITGANNDRINIPVNECATIAKIEGPGVIARIWITIDSRDPHFLRRILLRMYWDEEENPSVEVPVGDFFGTGFDYKHYY